MAVAHLAYYHAAGGFFSLYLCVVKATAASRGVRHVVHGRPPPGVMSGRKKVRTRRRRDSDDDDVINAMGGRKSGIIPRVTEPSN